MRTLDSTERLKKELGLFDVFAVSTGAMFSSGFFLLPGLAFAKAGPAVVLAYLLAGVLILPAMFSKAELSTALPRAGGTYYFLDRSLGPLAGTIGGLGTYFALSLKTAFALIGIGAYAAFFIELPIKPVAVALTIVFVIINIFGAKETTALQRGLVLILLAVMALFMVGGFVRVFGQPLETTTQRFTPFMTMGTAGLLSTIGFVFVSYAGLTKVASVAEEVKNADRNIPLGMMLSLGVTTLVYGVGIFLIVAVVEPVTLSSDLTPVATAAETLFDWMPAKVGLLLIVIAALAAFVSTGNAGMLAASRYPLAMARDRLLPQQLVTLGRFHTPVLAILVTGALMVVFIVALDAEGIAKLASAFQLFIFILVNFAVIVMRESRIDSYDPGYRSPLYPWMQVFGMVTSLLLIVYMGWEAIAFTIGIVVVCIVWYYFYAAKNVERDGAIYHWFSRLGVRQDKGLDREFRGIMKERGLRDNDPFEQIVARSFVIDLVDSVTYGGVVQLAAEHLAERIPSSADEIKARFLRGTAMGETPVSKGVALPHFRTVLIESAELVLVRCKQPVAMIVDDPMTVEVEPEQQVHALFFLISPEADAAQHLRILAQIAGRVDEASFAEAWAGAANEDEIRQVILRDDRFATIVVTSEARATGPPLCNQLVRNLELTPGCLIAIIQRGAESIIPSGRTVLQAGDRLTVIGQPEGIALLREFYDTVESQEAEAGSAPAEDAHAIAIRHVASAATDLSPEAADEIRDRLLFIAAKSVEHDARRAHEAIDALRRLETGTYGVCEKCGKTMRQDWLRQQPDTRACQDCLEKKSIESISGE